MIDSNFTGITLCKDAHKDADHYAHIFTREFGLIRAFVKSSQKTTSKLGPHLEPLLLVEGRYIEKKVPRIVDAITHNVFANIRKNAYYYDHSLALLRHIERHTGELQKDEVLWDSLAHTLHALDSAAQEEKHPQTLFRQAYSLINQALGYE